MTGPTEALMDEYANRPDLVAEFHALARRILAADFSGDAAHLNDAIDQAANERPDLFMAYVASRKGK